ncbi:MAG: molecular chaperone DnaJ, partial [Actinomycetota bacterium]|nr:molecular chaperone DnaJ [Actinomycetota bacterium]
MAPNRDFYEVLGVSKNAADDEIKKAYRELARKWHPDRNHDDPDAEERFKEVQQAYDTLSDPGKRKEYDSGAPFGGFGGVGAAGARGFPSGGFASDLGGIFSTFFSRGGDPGGGRAQRGRDLEAEVRLSFDQAMNGAQITVAVPTTETCPTCSGTGAKPGTSPRVCPRCGGRGVDAESQGVFSIQQPCPECNGQGQIIDEPCPTCSGAGIVETTKRYRVNIPAGVHDGSRIRLAGKGEAGFRGGPRGDLYVTTRVSPSPVFRQRPDGNLDVDLPVTVAEAIQGATIEVPTLNGSKKIRIPPGTQHGTTQRLRGEGPQRVKG